MAASKGTRAATGTECFDYLIVGAGTAGCILANRLSADPTLRVGLIECGTPHSDSYKWGYPLLSRDHSSVVLRKSVPQRHLNNRRITLRTHTSANFSYAHPRDFDEWAEAGATGWSYSEVQPYFHHAAPPELRQPPDSLMQRFLAATASLGLDFKIHCDGNTCGAPLVRRENLTLFSNSLAVGLILEERKARGVCIERAGVSQELHATRGVILCAGTYGSPHLLLLSGIGPGPILQTLGITVRHELPGVGESLQNHPSTELQVTTSKRHWRFLSFLWSRSTLDAIGFIKSRPREDRPDLQIVFRPTPCNSGFGITLIGVRPQSRGRLTLASPDPHIAPLVDPNFLDDSDDLRLMIEGATVARRILATPAFRTVRGIETLPGSQARDAKSWMEYIRSSTVGAHHPSSTCRMGRDSFAVVDSSLRVRGIENLRIADASVFPRVVAGNTNATVMMVAEKAAALIRTPA
jgi:choline dehydrogenase